MATLKEENIVETLLKLGIFLVCILLSYGVFVAISLFISTCALKVVYFQSTFESIFNIQLQLVYSFFSSIVALEFSKWGICAIAIILFFLTYEIKQLKKVYLFFSLGSLGVLIGLSGVASFLNSFNNELLFRNVLILACVNAFFTAKVFRVEKLIQFVFDPESRFPDFELFSKQHNTYGSADFLRKKEERKLFSKTNTGLIVDGVSKRLSEKHSTQNVLVCAPTGVGKTQTYILPNILGHHGQSFVVTDPSGELYKKTSEKLKKQGYTVLVLDLFKNSPEFCFNPLSFVNQVADAKKIGKILTQQVQSSGDPFWHTAASTYIAAMLLVCRDKSTKNNQNYLTFANLKKCLCYDNDELSLLMSDECIKPDTLAEIKGVLVGGEELLNSVRSVALTSIEIFSDKNFIDITKDHNLNLTKLRTEKTALFFKVPEHKISYSAPYISLFFSLLFETLFVDVKGKSVYVYLEEFANIGKIPDFDTVITTSRKRNISISIIVQDIQQIETAYKGKLDTIVSGGCLTKIFYSSLSQRSAQFASDLCGKKNQETHSKTEQQKINRGESETEAEAARNLLNPDEIRRLKENEAIIIHGNFQPCKIKLTPYYLQKK